MEVRTYLNRSVSSVGNGYLGAVLSCIYLNFAIFGDYLAGDNIVVRHDRLVNGNKLCSVGKCSFKLYLAEHFGNAVHNIITGEELSADAHKLGNGLSVTGKLKKLRGYVCHSFGIIELQSPPLSLLGKLPCGVYHKSFLFSWGKMHFISFLSGDMPKIRMLRRRIFI